MIYFKVHRVHLEEVNGQLFVLNYIGKEEIGKKKTPNNTVVRGLGLSLVA